jgi:hypothetical protein
MRCRNSACKAVFTMQGKSYADVMQRLLPIQTKMNSMKLQYDRYYKKAFERVLEFFNGDGVKTKQWMHTKNPGLGEVTPIDMVRHGRGEEVMKFIDSSLSQNEREEDEKTKEVLADVSMDRGL